MMNQDQLEPLSEENVPGGRLLRMSDGSAVLEPEEDANLPTKMGNEDLRQFNVNMALHLPTIELSRIGGTIKEDVDDDFRSQRPYMQATATAMRQLALQITNRVSKEGSSTEGGLAFTSGVYSMAFFESCMDLVLTAKNTLFKENDMVNPVIIGRDSDESDDLSERMKDWFNYYLTYDLKDFRQEAARALFWAVVAGYAYKKVYFDPIRQKPVSLVIPITQFAINRQHSSHHSSTRKTQLYTISEKELHIRRSMGLYIDTEVQLADKDDLDGDDVLNVLRAMQGIEESDTQRKETYRIAETHIELYIEHDPYSPEEKLPSPYIVTWDKTSGNVLSIHRNWKEEDPHRQPNCFFVCYNMLPSLDGEGYGMVNYAANQAQAATLVTRELLLGGVYANFPGGVYSQGLRIEGNEIRPDPGQFVPIATGSQRIQDCFMTLPYKEPSPALFSLLTALEEGIRKPSTIINQKISEMAGNAPASSTLALLESYHKVPNAIMQSFYESFGQELELFRQQFYDWLPEGQPYPFPVAGGSHAMMKQDFNPQIKVMPSGEPNLQNSSYRLIRAEIVKGSADAQPQLHDMRAVYAEFYKNMGLNQAVIEKILLPKPEPEQEPPAKDPQSENSDMMQGKPVKVYMWQDHDAHEAVHAMVLNDPSQQAIWPNVHAHIQVHKAEKMMIQMFNAIGMDVPQDPAQIPPEAQNQIAQALAQIANQQQQEQQQQQPIDPSMVALEKVEADREAAQLRAQTEHMRMEAQERIEKEKAEVKEVEMRLSQMQADNQMRLDELKIQLEIAQAHQSLEKQEKEIALKEVNMYKEILAHSNDALHKEKLLAQSLDSEE